MKWLFTILHTRALCERKTFIYNYDLLSARKTELVGVIKYTEMSTYLFLMYE